LTNHSYLFYSSTCVIRSPDRCALVFRPGVEIVKKIAIFFGKRIYLEGIASQKIYIMYFLNFPSLTVLKLPNGTSREIWLHLSKCLNREVISILERDDDKIASKDEEGKKKNYAALNIVRSWITNEINLVIAVFRRRGKFFNGMWVEGTPTSQGRTLSPQSQNWKSRWNYSLDERHIIYEA